MDSNTKYATREAWLNGFVLYAREQFARVGAPLPEKVRVSVGFTSTGNRGNRIGECWHDAASADGYFEIFLKPTIETDSRMADILTHELVHAAVGIEAAHGAKFKKVATALGLVGKMTSTKASADWYAWSLPILTELGAMPYGQLTSGTSSSPKKQKTNLLKVQCSDTDCGWTARVTRKHIGPHDHLNCPVPDCGGVLVVAETEAETE